MIVVDTSVAFKWFDPQEKSREQAQRILLSHVKGEEAIVIPDLFFYEIASAWSTKTNLTIEEIHQKLNQLEKAALTSISIQFSLLSHICAFSKQFHVSVYDASYAILAQEKGCDLITADAKFVQQVNLPFVKLLGQ